MRKRNRVRGADQMPAGSADNRRARARNGRSRTHWLRRWAQAGSRTARAVRMRGRDPQGPSPRPLSQACRQTTSTRLPQNPTRTAQPGAQRWPERPVDCKRCIASRRGPSTLPTPLSRPPADRAVSAEITVKAPGSLRQLGITHDSSPGRSPTFCPFAPVESFLGSVGVAGTSIG